MKTIVLPELPELVMGQLWQCRDQGLNAVVQSVSTGNRHASVHIVRWASTFDADGNPVMRKQLIAWESILYVSNKNEAAYRIKADRHNRRDLLQLLYPLDA